MPITVPSTKGAPPPAKWNTRSVTGHHDWKEANDRATCKVLLALCKKFKHSSANTQSTMALGIFKKGSDRVILVAAQSGDPTEAEAALEFLATASPKYKAYRHAFSRLNATGLHAEMIIIRHLMLTGRLKAGDVNGSAIDIGLQIACPAKLVCPDCAGYLRKHNIPHYPVECGDASKNWVNPRTGACFRATKSAGVTFYHKLNQTTPTGPGKVFGNRIDPPAGDLGPLPPVQLLSVTTADIEVPL